MTKHSGISKDCDAMIVQTAINTGLHGEAREGLIQAVHERLKGTPRPTKNQVRAAMTQEMMK